MNQIRQVQAQLRRGKQAWLREDEGKAQSEAMQNGTSNAGNDLVYGFFT
jgi:hypothetical protein